MTRRPRFRLPLQRAHLERELDDELRIHLEMRGEALRARGLTDDAARDEALRRFGDLEDARDYCRREDRRRLRETRRATWLDDLRQDVRAALRMLRRSPAFALAAVAVLAAGIGVTTAAYTVVHAYLVRPLPYPHADRLVSVIPGPTRDPFPNAPSLDGVDWRAVEPIFEATVSWDLDAFMLTGGAYPEGVRGAWVTPGYVEAFGVRTALGRGFRADEYVPGTRVAIISDALWARRFGRDPSVVGRAVRIHSADRTDGAELVTVVGVLRPDHWHVNQFTEVMRPLPGGRTPYMARLKPGMSLADAEARLDAAVRAQLGAVDPAWRMSLVSLQDEYTERVRPTLLALLFGSAFMLLIAAASVGGALVARAAARRVELEVRAALGASRGRLVRQLLTESVVLAALAAVGGAALASFLLRAVAPRLGDQLGPSVPGGAAAVIPDLPALALSVLASTLLGVALGVLPALASRRADAAAAVRGARGGVGGAGAAGVRRTLIAGQLALTTALLVGAALTTRTAVSLATRPLGFDAEGVVKGQFLLPRGRYPDAGSRRAGAERVLAAVRAVPGVRSAALVSWPPFRPTGAEPVTPEGGGGDRAVRAVAYLASPGYFETLGVALLAGRAIAERDDARAAPVVVVSEGAARRLWPDGSALGRRVRLGAEGPWRTVVGVVRDTRKPLLSEQFPDAYVPAAQEPSPFMSVVARAAPGADPRALAPALQRAVGAVDDEVVLAEVAPLAELVDRDGARPRALAALLGTFAALALALAALALYSSLSYVVSLRRRELAVRAAVGADAGRLTRVVVGEGARLTAVGLVAGAALSLALRRVIASQLHGVSPTDPASFAAIAVILAAAAALATAVPARRAARTDPAQALRGE